MGIEEVDATLQAEESLLGAILIESSDNSTQAISEVNKIVKSEDFYGVDRNSRVFEAMLRTEHPHQIGVAQTLYRNGKLASGDISYLCHLVFQCPCSLDYLDYAKAVKTYSLARQGYRQPPILKPIYRGFDTNEPTRD